MGLKKLQWLTKSLAAFQVWESGSFAAGKMPTLSKSKDGFRKMIFALADFHIMTERELFRIST